MKKWQKQLTAIVSTVLMVFSTTQDVNASRRIVEYSKQRDAEEDEQKAKISEVVTDEVAELIITEALATLIGNGTVDESKYDELINGIKDAIMRSDGAHPGYIKKDEYQPFTPEAYKNMDLVEILNAMKIVGLQKGEDGKYFLRNNYPVDNGNIYITGKNKDGFNIVNVALVKQDLCNIFKETLEESMNRKGIETYASYTIDGEDLKDGTDLLDPRYLATSTTRLDLLNSDLYIEDGIPLEYFTDRAFDGIRKSDLGELPYAGLQVLLYKYRDGDPEFKISTDGLMENLNLSDEKTLLETIDIGNIFFDLKEKYGLDIDPIDTNESEISSGIDGKKTPSGRSDGGVQPGD